jgi:Zn-dependent peptidase ImmA (M78 family)
MDDIATMVLQEYMPEVLVYPQPVDIDALVEEHLFLTVKNKALGYNDAVLGVTAFEDVKDVPCLDEMYQPTTIDLEAGTVLIHSCLLGSKNKPRRRFTVAHEGSHWILHRSYHSPLNQKFTFRTQRSPYIACRSANIEKTHYELKTDDDWEEWQADSLASALLMPLNQFHLVAHSVIGKFGKRYLSDKVIRNYIECVEEIADTFVVSRKATEIRLKQLGYIKKEQYSYASFSY